MPLRLYFESSRGCWWGAKHHCTFCGLNGSTMAFRRKDAGCAIRRSSNFPNTYRCLELLATDNILATDYLDQLLPRLAERDTDITLFLKSRQRSQPFTVSKLRGAGITRIQPGIGEL